MLRSLPNQLTIVVALAIALIGCAADSPSPAALPATDPVTSAPIEKQAPGASSTTQEEGAVIISVLIKADGSVGDIRVEQSSGSAKLDDATVKFYREKAVFQPATQDGKKIDAWKTLRVTWKLKDNQQDTKN